MIKKQSLWFLTIFSLIIVLSIYYITMPNELLINNNSNVEAKKVSTVVDDSDSVVKIEESELLVTMRVNLTDEREKEIKLLKSNLISEDATAEEKNAAFEKIKYITNLSSKEEMLEKKIKNELGIDCFIKIDESLVNVIAVEQKHNVEIANRIMQIIQSEFENKKNITVKFEK